MASLSPNSESPVLQFTHRGLVLSRRAYLSLTLQAPLDLLDHMTQLDEELTQQPGPIVQPSLALGSTPNQQLFWALN